MIGRTTLREQKKEPTIWEKCQNELFNYTFAVIRNSDRMEGSPEEIPFTYGINKSHGLNHGNAEARKNRRFRLPAGRRPVRNEAQGAEFRLSLQGSMSSSREMIVAAG